MGKYKNAKILQTAIDEAHQQEQLRLKHDILDENIVVVEKKSILKWVFLFLRVLFSITLISFAAIGIYTLLYPELRNIFIDNINNILNTIMR